MHLQSPYWVCTVLTVLIISMDDTQGRTDSTTFSPEYLFWLWSASRKKQHEKCIFLSLKLEVLQVVVGLECYCSHDGPGNIWELWRSEIFYWTNCIVVGAAEHVFIHQVPFLKSPGADLLSRKEQGSLLEEFSSSSGCAKCSLWKILSYPRKV